METTITEKSWALADDGWLVWGAESGDQLLGPLAVAQAIDTESEEDADAVAAYEALTQAVEDAATLAEMRVLYARFKAEADRSPLSAFAALVELLALFEPAASDKDPDR